MTQTPHSPTQGTAAQQVSTCDCGRAVTQLPGAALWIDSDGRTGHENRPTQTTRKALKPGDLVTRGAGTARWVVNFIHPSGGSVTLVRENQKTRSGSTRWWDEREVFPVNR
jgi:hypothetical protein